MAKIILKLCAINQTSSNTILKTSRNLKKKPEGNLVFIFIVICLIIVKILR